MSALRERRKVHLRVDTTNTRTGRFTRYPSPLTLPSSPYTNPIPPPATTSLHHLHHLFPSLYLALSPKTGRIPSTIISANGSPFTHIIRVLPDPNPNGGKSSNLAGRWRPQQDPERGVYFLDLYVGEPFTDDENEDLPGVDPYLVLTREQLVMARDFLGLALPHYRQAHMRTHGRSRGRGPSYRSLQALAEPPGLPTSSDSARVLVTAPWGFGLEMDIMAIVVCYLVYTSGEPPWLIWSYIRAEAGVPEIWRDALEEVDAMREIHIAAAADI